MKKYIFLLLLISCEQAIEKRKYCFKMIRISDATPIKFWLNGQPSYNNTPEPGVDHICFYQPFNCEDEIKFQFIGEPNNLYDVQLLDSLGVKFPLIDLSPFLPTNGILYNYKFTPDVGVCDQKISIKIIEKENANTNFIQNSEFTSDISGWTQVNVPAAGGGTGQGELWSYSAGSAQVTLPITGAPAYPLISTAKLLEQTFSNKAAGNYRFRYKLDFSHISSFDSQLATLNIQLLNGGTSVFIFPSITLSSTNTGLEKIFDFTTTSLFNKISIFVQGNSVNTVPVVVGIDYIEVISMSGLTDGDVYETDLIDLRQIHENTLWISVTNKTDYAGLVYQDVNESFGVRVKAKFYEQRFPEENESEPDGEGNVDKLSSTTKTQVLLEVDPMPPYRHKQLKLALQHNSIFIKNLAWVKEESYELEKVSEKHPFFKAKVWLTQQSNEYILNS